jgi:hypothetical protein
LLTLLGFQCLQLYRAATEPFGSSQFQPDPPAFDLAEFDPFFRSGASSLPPPLALTLHGTRESGRAGPSAAIIGLPSGEQRSFMEGAEVLPKVVLEAVGKGEITLACQDTRQKIYLPDFSATAAAAATAIPTAQGARGGPAGGSINFADPRTLPRSLTAPASGTIGSAPAVTAPWR